MPNNHDPEIHDPNIPEGTQPLDLESPTRLAVVRPVSWALILDCTGCSEV
jgi:hypothetical protein